MAAQLTLNYREGRRRADEGIARVSAHQSEFVSKMRAEAIRMAQALGSVTADDVRKRAAEWGLTAPHKNCWGAIFRGRGWHRIGERPSEVPGNHAHRNPVWMYHDWTRP